MQAMGDWGRWLVRWPWFVAGIQSTGIHVGIHRQRFPRCWLPSRLPRKPMFWKTWKPRLPRRWLPSQLPRKPMFLDGTQRCGTRTGTHGKGHFRLRTLCMGKPSKKFQQKYPHSAMAHGLAKYPHHPNLDHQKCELLTQWDRTFDAGFMHTPEMIAVAFSAFM